MMRKVAFGYSTHCNVRCDHCVAAGEVPKTEKMELGRASQIIEAMAAADVKGISFTAGEPLMYLDDIAALTALCSRYSIYSRVVTNSYWATTPEEADRVVSTLKDNGLRQLRLSYSRWHQKNIPKENVLHAARSCERNGIDYFVSFVSDFSKEDDPFEKYLRSHDIRFFPEPVIYSGRAKDFFRVPLHTDYQENRCAMNPFIAPSQDMFACCDAGSHFSNTDFFHLGNLQESEVETLLDKCEKNVLYNHIRNIGISGLALFAGYTVRDIVQYRKCELCEKLFNSAETLSFLSKEAESGLYRLYR